MKTPRYCDTLIRLGAQLALVALGARSSPSVAADPPNFVLIFVDDQGYRDVGCFGSPDIRTPHLDRMAKEGMRFTDFYALAPVCSASRAALMTGCYPPRVSINGVLFPRHRVGLNPKEVTIAEVLKQKGYATACIGKWHLGHLPRFLPTNHGFDSYFGIPYSNDMDKARSPGKGVKGLDHAYATDDSSFWNVPLMRDTEIVERPAKQLTLTKRYTEEAVKFIGKNKRRPFFLYLAHTMPHIPLFATEEFKGKSGAGPYGDVIQEVDASVGKVLAALEANGVDDNTLVVYTSDNGPWLSMKHHGGSALPLRAGKFSTYEGGMRVPAIMRWRGTVPPGTTCREVAATFDLLPTFARLANARLPTDRAIDGKDISPQLRGEKDARSPHEIFCYYRGGRLEAVRSGKWKTRFARRGRQENAATVELYNLADDIGESKNLYSSQPEIADRLRETARRFDEELQKNKRPVGSLTTAKASVGKAVTEDGVLVHRVTSPYQAGTTEIRVLLPEKRVPGKRFKALYVLPVEARNGTRWGDALLEVRKAGLHSRHDLVCVYPTFSHLPWYADHPDDPTIRQETYFLEVVVPFIERTYPVRTDRDGRLLVGFSKSGWGAFSLLLRHPDRFGGAAAWDAPLTMERPNKFGMAGIFATRANFERYEITSLLEAKAGRLGSTKRLALLGYGNFRDHHRKLHAKLDELNIPHSYRDGPARRHHWASGWLEEAVELLTTRQTATTSGLGARRPKTTPRLEPNQAALFSVASVSSSS